jgi:hypothetical protein
MFVNMEYLEKDASSSTRSPATNCSHMEMTEDMDALKTIPVNISILLCANIL